MQFRVDERSLSPYWHIRKYVTNNNQHDFSLSQKNLINGSSFKSIASQLGKDPSTISKEVKRNLSTRPTDYKRTTAHGSELEIPKCEFLLRAPYKSKVIASVYGRD